MWLENTRSFTQEEMSPRLTRFLRQIHELPAIQVPQRPCQRDNAVLLLQMSAQVLRRNPDDHTLQMYLLERATFLPQSEVLEEMRKHFPNPPEPWNAMWVEVRVYLNSDPGALDMLRGFTFVLPLCNYCHKQMPRRKDRHLCNGCAALYYCSERCRDLDRPNHTDCPLMRERWTNNILGLRK